MRTSDYANQVLVQGTHGRSEACALAEDARLALGLDAVWMCIGDPHISEYYLLGLASRTGSAITASSVTRSLQEIVARGPTSGPIHLAPEGGPETRWLWLSVSEVVVGLFGWSPEPSDPDRLELWAGRALALVIAVQKVRDLRAARNQSAAAAATSRRLEHALFASAQKQLTIERLARELEDARTQLEQRGEALEATVDERTRQLRIANAELHGAMLAAREASLAKSEFLANMSHELRTPLNAIIGYTELASECATELPEVVSDLERVRRAAHHLLAMIEQILDLSVIEAGKLRLWIQPVPLAQAIREIVETVEPLVGQGQNEITWDIDGDPIARADPQRVRQILLNLVANAAKFTDRGQIAVRCWADPDRVWVTVSDTGIGMTQEILERVFEKFTQGDSSPTRRHGGTGLGLSICRQLATALGGEITVRSEYGCGSKFTLELPTWQEPEADSAGGSR